MSEMDDTIDAFIRWSKEQGILIDGVRPAVIQRTSFGIVALRALSAGETVVVVPASALLTAVSDCVTKQKLNFWRTSVRAQLVAGIILSEEFRTRSKDWRALWPSSRFVYGQMLLFWPKELQRLFTPEIKVILASQRKKLWHDWSTVEPFLPPKSKAYFIYLWLLVHTRSSYWECPPRFIREAGVRKFQRAQYDDEDRIALAPFVDCFKHFSTGCFISSGPDSITVTCDRAYEAGDELFVSQCPCTNDDLIAEFGWLPSIVNVDDFFTIDHLIVPRLTQGHKYALQDRHILGNYYIAHCEDSFLATEGPISLRVKQAWCLLSCSAHALDKLLAGKADDNEFGYVQVARYGKKMIGDYMMEIKGIVRKLQSLDASAIQFESRRTMLMRRWLQVWNLLVRAMQYLSRYISAADQKVLQI